MLPPQLVIHIDPAYWTSSVSSGVKILGTHWVVGGTSGVTEGRHPEASSGEEEEEEGEDRASGPAASERLTGSKQLRREAKRGNPRLSLFAEVRGKGREGQTLLSDVGGPQGSPGRDHLPGSPAKEYQGRQHLLTINNALVYQKAARQYHCNLCSPTLTY